MQKEDYRELWQERMLLELISGYGTRITRNERAQAARVRVSEILQRISQEIQEQFVAEMKENYAQFLEARAKGLPS